MLSFPTIETLVRDAFTKFDPASRIEPDYEAEIQVTTHILTQFRQQEPEAAAHITVDQLAEFLTQAFTEQVDLGSILSDFAASLTVNSK